jgi:hypothetical protein
MNYPFDQRARAALRALRSSGVIFVARAAPPFAPPSFPRAPAAAFFSFSGGDGGCSPDVLLKDLEGHRAGSPLRAWSRTNRLSEWLCPSCRMWFL